MLMHDAVGEALAERRIEAVLPHVRGRLLDLGCGRQQARCASYADGVGVDVHPWRGADFIVPDSASLAVGSAIRSTPITIIAAPQSHPEPGCGAARVPPPFARRTGTIVVTMLTPRTSRVWHWLRAPWDADQRERGMRPRRGLRLLASPRSSTLFAACGFTLASQRRFMFGLNRVYVFRPVAAIHFRGVDAIRKRLPDLQTENLLFGSRPFNAFLVSTISGNFLTIAS